MAASSSSDDHGASVVATGVPAPASHDSTLPLSVLTVGDGNFSFSLAYLKKQQLQLQQQQRQRHRGIRLVATSFDSYEELIDKYPESVRICAQLRELGAVLLHRVDATNLQVSLRNAAIAAGITDDDASMPHRFHRVIFNHPHCGEENVARHQSLLSHFFVSAQRLLKTGSGCIHLTLAHGQPQRWEATQRAARAQLVVVEQIDDVDANAEYGVSYERKRHQNGKSFHRVLLHGERKEQSSTLFVLATAASQTTSTAAAAATPPELAANEATTTTRKRKASVERETETETQTTAVAVVPTAPATPFVCEPCEKSFKTAQGLKTHVHMVHKLQLADVGAAAAAAATLLPCGECDRTFKNEDARRQHQISKHGSDASIRPDWFCPSTVPSEAAANTNDGVGKTCPICALSFADTTAFDAHWQELQPKTVAKRKCALCTRAFEEERALRQHQNFCRAKAEKAQAESR